MNIRAFVPFMQVSVMILGITLLTGCFGGFGGNENELPVPDHVRQGSEVEQGNVERENSGDNKGDNTVIDEAEDLTDEIIATKYFETNEKEVKSKLIGVKKLGVFFYEENCQTCDDIEEEIRENLDELDEETVIARLDYKKEGNFRREFGVSIPSSVLTFGMDGSLLEVLVSPTLEQILVSLMPEEVDL